jgi:K+-sensing histidine kinase KdpD
MKIRIGSIFTKIVLWFTVSRELRSPLARLEFAVELVRSSPDIDSALGRIRREIDRLNHLVDEVLQLTRAEWDSHARNPAEQSLANCCGR